MPSTAVASSAIQIIATIIAPGFAAFVGGLFGVIVRGREYRSEYHKRVLDRRIAAYEHLEELIQKFRLTSYDVDNKMYHFELSKNDNWSSAYELMHIVNCSSLWLSDRASEKALELNKLLILLGDESPVEFAKTHYARIAIWRSELEGIMAGDLLELHDIRRFLRAKRDVKSEFQLIKLRSHKKEDQK